MPLLEQSPKFNRVIWEIAAQRLSSNIIKAQAPYSGWNPKKLKGWLNKGELVMLKKGESHPVPEDKISILCHGTARISGSNSVIAGPVQISTPEYSMITDGVIYLLNK